MLRHDSNAGAARLTRFFGTALLASLVALCLPLAAARADTPPPYDGAMTFPMINGPSDPEEFSWQVTLNPGQELEQIDDRTAAIYYSDDHQLALSINAELAHDAGGTNVPTTLAVTNPDVITLTVHHRAGNPLASGAPFSYPISAGQGWEGGYQPVIITGPPDEWELRQQREREEHEATRTRLEAERCHVPRLKGRSLRAAEKLLREAHCSPGKLNLHRGSRLRGAKVIRQSSRPGTVLPPATTVDLTLK